MASCDGFFFFDRFFAHFFSFSPQFPVFVTLASKHFPQFRCCTFCRDTSLIRAVPSFTEFYRVSYRVFPFGGSQSLVFHCERFEHRLVKYLGPSSVDRRLTGFLPSFAGSVTGVIRLRNGRRERTAASGREADCAPGVRHRPIDEEGAPFFFLFSSSIGEWKGQWRSSKNLGGGPEWEVGEPG